jgi:hypothetical protein
MWTRGRRRNNVPHWHRRSRSSSIVYGVTPRSAAETLSMHATFQHPHLTLQWWDDFRWPLSIGAHSPALNIRLRRIYLNGRAHLPLEMRDGWTFKWTKGSLCVCEAPRCAGQLALRRLFLLPKVTFYVLSRLRWLGECFWPPASTTLQYEEAAGNFVLRPAFIVLP